MNWKIENNSVKDVLASMKKKVIIVTVLCMVLLCIFSADIWQHKRFATLQHGYSCMEQRQYDEAIVDFEEYLDIDSVIYWYLIEHINDKSYSRKNVTACLKKCMLLQASSTWEYPKVCVNL